MNYFVVSRSHESLQSDEFGPQKLGGSKCGGSDSNAEGMLRSGHKWGPVARHAESGMDGLSPYSGSRGLMVDLGGRGGGGGEGRGSSKGEKGGRLYCTPDYVHCAV